MPTTSTADRILDVAERLAQTRGFNGFSYADIAAELGVTKASLHYHFRSKSDLGSALIERYLARFEHALTGIDRDTPDAYAKLQRYVGLYDAVMVNDRACLCGMLAAEYSTLPEAMQAALRRFFDANERWLGAVLAKGRRARTLAFRESAKERARLVLGALEGAMLVARTYGDASRFRATARHVIAELAA